MNTSTRLQSARVALSQRERAAYSLLGAIRALADGRPQDAGLAFEISQDLAKGRELHSINSLCIPAFALARRDLIVATASAGGYLVGTDNDELGVVELLRGRSAIVDLGATILSGLRDSITIPRETAGVTATWLSNENAAVTPADQTLSQVALSPKHCVAITKFSKQLAKQSSPSVEAFVVSSLTASLGVALDNAAINGAGASGQPLGLIGTSGIGSVVGTSIDLQKINEFQTDAGNTLTDSFGYVTTRATAELLSRRAALSSGTERALWTGALHRGELAGCPALTAPSVPTAVMIGGTWENLVIAEWGPGIEISIDPYTAFNTGQISARVWLTCDVGVVRPAAFSVASSIT